MNVYSFWVSEWVVHVLQQHDDDDDAMSTIETEEHEQEIKKKSKLVSEFEKLCINCVSKTLMLEWRFSISQNNAKTR